MFKFLNSWWGKNRKVDISVTESSSEKKFLQKQEDEQISDLIRESIAEKIKGDADVELELEEEFVVATDASVGISAQQATIQAGARKAGTTLLRRRLKFKSQKSTQPNKRLDT